MHTLDISTFKTYLPEFLDLYKRRPIQDNTGGMKSPHLFATFCALKQLQPKLIIESGVWKGQGTWLFNQVCPEAMILSFDIAFENLEYRNPQIQYIQDDIISVDWFSTLKTIKLKSDEALLFLDDHQNFFDRLKWITDDSPFTHIIVEDNYPTNQGDCLSPKKLLEGYEYVIDVNNIRLWHTITNEQKELFHSHIDVYQELPPIFKPDVTRWGDSWDNYPTLAPILDLTDSEYDEFKLDYLDYTWICYLRIRR